MKLLTKKFKKCSYEWNDELWWEDIYSKKYEDCYELCDNVMDDLVDIPSNVKQIEIVLSTTKLSNHSLVITETFEQWSCDQAICVDGMRTAFVPPIHILLSRRLKKHKKLFATVYYKG